MQYHCNIIGNLIIVAIMLFYIVKLV